MDTFGGLRILELNPIKDERGRFQELFRQKEFGKLRFVQDNLSFSKKNVVRGLHFQRKPHQQAKLVYCLQGKILDVAVDLRKNSKTFGRVFRIILTPSRALFIPKWFAHGFSVLSKSALVYYKCSDYYYPELSERIRWDDETLKIDWMLEGNPIVSKFDESGVDFGNII